MENTTLNVTLEQAIKQADQLNSKLTDINKTTEQLTTSNTAMNISLDTMNEAISNLGSSIPSVTSAFQLYKTAQEQVNVACKAFAANPVGAALQIIATVLAVVNAIVDKFKEKIGESDEATHKWNEAIAAFEPIMRVFNKAIEYVVDKFVDLIEVVSKGVEWLEKFGEKLANAFGYNTKAVTEAVNESKKFAKLQKEIDEDELKRIHERAKSEAKQGELREKIAEAEGKNKVKLLNDLKEEIKLQTAAEIALNRKRIALMKHQQEQSATSTAEKKQLAELEAQTDRLIGQQGLQLARIARQIKATTTTVASDTKKTSDDTVKKLIDNIKNYADERNKILEKANKDYATDNSLTNVIRKQEDVLLKLRGASEQKILQVKRDRLAEDAAAEKKNYETQKTNLLETISKLESYHSKNADVKKEIDNNLFTYKTKLDALETQHLISEYEKQTESYRLQIEEQKIITDDFNNQRKEVESKLAEENKQYADELAKREEEEMIRRENTITSIEETVDFIIDNFDKLSEPEQLLFDSLGKTTAVIYEQVKAFKDLGDGQKNAANKTKLAFGTINAALSAATAVVNSYMNAKQDQIQQDLESGKITEEEAKKQFEKTKKVQIAMATINMMQGIATAISTAMQLGPIAGPIIGAINAAAVAASGALQIKNIKKQTIEGAGGDSSEDTGISSFGSIGTVTDYGASSGPLLNEEFDTAQLTQSTSTTGDSTIQNQRVYILESDIQESNNRVEIRESNTTF